MILTSTRLLDKHVDKQNVSSCDGYCVHCVSVCYCRNPVHVTLLLINIIQETYSARPMLPSDTSIAHVKWRTIETTASVTVVQQSSCIQWEFNDS